MLEPEFGDTMESIETPHTCRYCGGKIVEYAESIPLTDSMHMPIGPSSNSYYRHVSTYSCSGCGLLFDWRFFGEKPHSVLLAEQEQARRDEAERAELQERFDKSWKAAGMDEKVLDAIAAGKKPNEKPPRT